MAQPDHEESELLRSVEKDEWRSVENLKGEIDRYRNYAKAAAKKDRRINIRISSQDLEALQDIAMEEGIPYQTLITSILHKYASGRLVDRKHLAIRP